MSYRETPYYQRDCHTSHQSWLHYTGFHSLTFILKCFLITHYHQSSSDFVILKSHFKRVFVDRLVLTANTLLSHGYELFALFFSFYLRVFSFIFSIFKKNFLLLLIERCSINKIITINISVRTHMVDQPTAIHKDILLA